MTTPIYQQLNEGESNMIFKGKDIALKAFVIAIGATIGLGMANPASAGTASAGNITSVLPHTAGGLFFNQTGTRTGRPSCSVADRWVINTTNAAGQAVASALLTAWSLHKQIAVTGSGACDVWADTETVVYFVIID